MGSEPSGRSQRETEKKGKGMHKCEIMEVPVIVEGILLKHRTKAGKREWLEVEARKVGWVQAVKGPL